MSARVMMVTCGAVSRRFDGSYRLCRAIVMVPADSTGWAHLLELGWRMDQDGVAYCPTHETEARQ